MTQWWQHGLKKWMYSLQKIKSSIKWNYNDSHSKYLNINISIWANIQPIYFRSVLVSITQKTTPHMIQHVIFKNRIYSNSTAIVNKSMLTPNLIVFCLCGFINESRLWSFVTEAINWYNYYESWRQQGYLCRDNCPFIACFVINVIVIIRTYYSD